MFAASRRLDALSSRPAARRLTAAHVATAAPAGAAAATTVPATRRRTPAPPRAGGFGKGGGSSKRAKSLKETGRRLREQVTGKTVESKAEARPCPCGSGLAGGECCLPLIRGRVASAPTPDALMRSRYTAFQMGSGEATDARRIDPGCVDYLVRASVSDKGKSGGARRTPRPTGTSCRAWRGRSSRCARRWPGATETTGGAGGRAPQGHADSATRPPPHNPRQTSASSASDPGLARAVRDTMRDLDFLSLQVFGSEVTADGTSGEVRFQATARLRGQDTRSGGAVPENCRREGGVWVRDVWERSTFARGAGGEWQYVEGDATWRPEDEAR